MNKLFIFIAGCSVGSLVTWKLIEKKYKDLADEEIESVKEMYKKRIIEEQDLINKRQEGKIYDGEYKEVPNEDEEDYYDKLDDLGYSTESDDTEEAKRIEVLPYLINEEEFGETGNNEMSLMYYSDFILVDEDDEIITDPESLLGDLLNEFGDPNIERIYVRDDANETDYVILRSEKTYKEVYSEEEY